MSDFEDAAFYFESFTSPPNPKRKKKSKKDRKDPKPKMCEVIKTLEGVREKNKTSKFKETMKNLKEKKKEKRRNKNKEKRKMKKKKKNKELDDDFTLTQCSSTPARRFEKLETPGKPKDSTKEGKRKKMVAFGSLPTYIRVKRPQFSSSTPKGTEDVRENESCSQVSSTGRTQNEAQDDVQWNSDDLNSQDLFITQKTFRTSPSETSSGEASDGVITASPHVFTQKNTSQNAAEINKTQEKSHGCPREDGVLELQQEKISSQIQKEFKPSVAQQKRASDPKWMNPFLDEPLVINETPEEHSSSALPRGESFLLPPRRANSSTQTENFFTSELSSYLNFCQKSRVAACSEDLKPLDLSLRKDLGLSVETNVINAKPDLEKSVVQGEKSDDRSKGVSANPQEKPAEVKKEPPPCETTPSPQSEADTKSADTTASSEDDHHARSAKKDLMQVGAVQLRLNKPFFFKTKGEWQSPRPESPLTKLCQGRDPKSKKCR